MTQEEKELLLRDLCARLPYHPFFKRKDDIMPLYNINTYCGVIDCIPSIKIEDCRLYLRPMSSMTEEEKKEIGELLDASIEIDTDGNITYFSGCDFIPCSDYQIYIDYLNAHHLDYRGLISKGLALEAPANMYK